MRRDPLCLCVNKLACSVIKQQRARLRTMVRVSDMVESHGMGGGSPPTEDIEVVSGTEPPCVEEDCGAGSSGAGCDGGRGSCVEDEVGTGSKGSVKVGRAVAVLAKVSSLSIAVMAVCLFTFACTSVISAICAGGNSHGKCVPPGIAFVDVEQLGHDGTVITMVESFDIKVASTHSLARWPGGTAVEACTLGVVVVCLGGNSHI